MQDNRPQTRLGSIKFQFAHPQLESSGSATKATHEVLSTDENQGQTTVIQPQGRESRRWTLRGDCYRETATALDELVGEVVALRHARHSGEVFVDDVSTDPSGSWETQDGETVWRYTYRAKLIEVV